MLAMYLTLDAGAQKLGTNKNTEKFRLPAIL